MMFVMSRSRGFCLLVLSVFSLFVGAVHGSAIICIEADGRMVVENAGSRCCTSLALSLEVSNSVAVSPVESDSCGPCLDIPLLLSSLQSIQLRNSVRLPASDVDITSSGGIDGFRGPIIATPILRSQHILAVSPPKLRSVVLRF